MHDNLIVEVKNVITNSINASLSADQMPDDFQLAGNVLDSMAVTNLIIALEEYFGIMFDDDGLTPEDFETVASLSKLVESKLQFSDDRH